MEYIQTAAPFNRFNIEQAMKPDEVIVYENKKIIVAMDSRGEIALFDKQKPFCIVTKE